MRKTLIVDDEKALAATLARALTKCGCDCAVVHDVAAARELAHGERALDLAVVDIGLPDGSGLDLVEPLRRGLGHPAVVVVTGRHDHEATADAFQRGAVDCLIKPLDFDELATLVERLFQMRDSGAARRIEAASAPPERGHVLVAKSPEMRQVLRDVARCSMSGATVLVTGEVGVGKQTVARAIRTASSHDPKPFVVFQCAASTPAAFECAVAPAGVLFLDEVADLPRATQEALLRYLGDRCFSGSAPGSAGARVIAATSRVLEEEVAAGRFDEDLFRRLHIVVIRVPPLRRRAADFSVLLDRTVAAAAHARGVRALVLDRDAERLLFAHDWKGNIGELVEVTRRLLVSGNRHIGIDAVRSALASGARIPSPPAKHSERRP